MADDAGQTVFATDTYDEYGIPGSGNVGRFQYTGQAWLAELGMYCYKARIYSPSLGRFMQTDPIGYTDRYNLYEYAGDDPVDGTDPTGLCTGTNIDTSNVTNCDNGHDAATMGGCIGNCSGSHTQNLVSSGPETEDEGVRGANLLGIEIDVDGPNREQEFSDAYDKWGQLEPKNPNRDHLESV